MGESMLCQLPLGSSQKCDRVSGHVWYNCSLSACSYDTRIANLISRGACLDSVPGLARGRCACSSCALSCILPWLECPMDSRDGRYPWTYLYHLREDDQLDEVSMGVL